MKITIFALMTVLFSVLIMGCSSNHQPDQSRILAEVGGEKILLEDLFDNPTFTMLVDNFITEKIILQEFEARHLEVTDNKFEEEWGKFVQSRAQGDELKLREDLQQQGIDLEYMKAQVRTQVKFQLILEDEFPITLEDARENFESNLQVNQRMYSRNVPEKTDNPETITFDDVSEFVIMNMKSRLIQAEAQNLISTLKDEYRNKGWIKNYVKPDELKDLTTIKPKAEPIQEMEGSRIKPAPVRKTNKQEPEKHDDSNKLDESGKDDESEKDDSKKDETSDEHEENTPETPDEEQDDS